jgi:hypothetical protein
MASSIRTRATRLQSTAATLGGTTSAQPPGLVVLGRYRLHRPLGAGGFGTVWLARDERLERDVAVKVLARERVVGGRFEREARAAARLSHPAIVTLYEAAVDDDAAYLVSELVRGATLSELLDAGRLSDRDIVEIGIAVSEALSHAHAQRVVHRDVKPSNVLIPEQPAAGQVAKLTDFGVARLIGSDTLTRTGDVVGTAAYMAPEQADGREAGAAADLYSLALVLYEALTGVNPLALGTPAQRARRLGAHLPPLRRQRRDLPGELGHGIDLALRPRPRERGTVEELRAELVAALNQVEDRPGVVEPAWPRRSRPPEIHAELPSAPAELPSPGRELPAGFEERASLRWPARVLAGAAAALASAWLLTRLPDATPIAPAAAGLAGFFVVAALPRLGWLALMVALGALLAFQAQPGAALLLLAVVILPIFLMPRQRMSWPLAALAPGLGALGVAGAWPALAARASTPWRRAALGALGWVWTLAAGVLAGRGLYTRLPSGLPTGWPGSLAQTVNHLGPKLLAPGMLAPALAWAIGAAVLPWLTARSLTIQLVLLTVWSAGLASATTTLLRVGYARAQAPSSAVVLGALAAGALALAPAVLAQVRMASGRPQLA